MNTQQHEYTNKTGSFFEFEDVEGGRELLITLQKATPGFCSWTKLLESDDHDADKTTTHRTWFDIEAGGGVGVCWCMLCVLMCALRVCVCVDVCVFDL